MGQMEKISVIIPVYNTEKYLENSVRSVMAQTYHNLEIICVNDGSPDSSAEILERLQKEDNRIVVVNKSNGGLGDARNEGLKYATSEWIAFVDSDDTIQPDTFEIVSRAFPYNPDMIHWGVNVICEPGIKRVASDEKYYAIKSSGMVEFNDNIRWKSDTVVWNKLFRKSILDKYDIHFDKIWYEDLPFTMQYMLAIQNVYYIRTKLYNYLRRSGSIMSETFCGVPRAIDHLRGADSVLSFLDRHSMMSGHYSIMIRMFVSCYMLSLRYTTDDKIPEIIEFAKNIYDRYDFMHSRITPKVVQGTQVYVSQRKRKLSSRILQKLFSIRLEWIDYKQYKVVRLFDVILIKKLRS